MTEDLKQCRTCRNGPNPDGRLFPSIGHTGCGRMLKIDNVFPSLSDPMKDRAEDLSTGIVIFLQSMWRKEGETSTIECPGWQR